jgi:hypothetical protein
MVETVFSTWKLGQQTEDSIAQKGSNIYHLIVTMKKNY